MTTHLAGPSQLPTYAGLVGQRHHRRHWTVERWHEVAADLGDYAEDVYQVGMVVVASVLVLCVAGLAAVSLWELSPHFAIGMAAALPMGAGVLVGLHKTRPLPSRPALAAAETVEVDYLAVVDGVIVPQAVGDLDPMGVALLAGWPR